MCENYRRASGNVVGNNITFRDYVDHQVHLVKTCRCRLLNSVGKQSRRKEKESRRLGERENVGL